MTTGPEKLVSTVRNLMDGDAGRPKPGASFLTAVAEYVAATRRFEAAQTALLAQVDAFEMAVWAAEAETGDDPADAVLPAAEPDVPRVSRGMAAARSGRPGQRASRKLAGWNHRG